MGYIIENLGRTEFWRGTSAAPSNNQGWPFKPESADLGAELVRVGEPNTVWPEPQKQSS